MSTLITAAAVLAMMLDAEPTAAASPWRSSYEDSADAISTVANDSPLFAGDDGPLRTAALFVSTSWFEANFHIAAKGDCRKKDERGRCVAEPQSLGLYQIGVSNLAGLGVTEEDMTTDPLVQTRAARRMMAISFGICSGRAVDDLLGQYASGGSTCAGVEKSGHRVRKAKWLADRAKKRAAEK